MSGNVYYIQCKINRGGVWPLLDLDLKLYQTRRNKRHDYTSTYEKEIYIRIMYNEKDDL